MEIAPRQRPPTAHEESRPSKDAIQAPRPSATTGHNRLRAGSQHFGLGAPAPADRLQRPRRLHYDSDRDLTPRGPGRLRGQVRKAQGRVLGTVFGSSEHLIRRRRYDTYSSTLRRGPVNRATWIYLSGHGTAQGQISEYRGIVRRISIHLRRSRRPNNRESRKTTQGSRNPAAYGVQTDPPLACSPLSHEADPSSSC